MIAVVNCVLVVQLLFLFAAVAASPEQLRSTVSKVYSAALDRCPTPKDMVWAMSELATGKTASWLVQNCVKSPEYFQKRLAGRGNVDKLDTIYQSMLERKCDRSGLQTWSGMMNNQESIGVVTEAISNSPEYQQRFGNAKIPNEATLKQKCCVEDSISQAYCRVLDRCPDPGGFDTCLKMHKNHPSTREIVRMLATSAEFSVKFIQKANVDPIDAMFQRLLGRPPDSSGRLTWQREMGRIGWREVINQILNSTEYQLNFGEDKIPGAGRSGCKCCIETGSQAVPQSDLPQCAAEQSSSPCPKIPAKYRTINGICNNPQHYLWGSTGIPYVRLAPAVGPSSANIGFKDYVNSRTISQLMVTEGQTSAVDNQRTALVVWWGQFLSHEITFAAENGAPCATLEDNFDKCANIELSTGDVLKATRDSLPLLRTKACTKTGQREQINGHTAFIDGSVIYGPTQARLDFLKSPTSALLNTNSQFTDKNGEKLLTYRDASNPQDPTKCMIDKSLPKNECWRSGDIRSNAVVTLTVVHTLFHREHNRIVEKLAELNPGWNQTQLFEEARKITAAIIAKITFDDYLPVIIGLSNMQAMGAYRYDPSLDPSLFNEVGVAVMRFGHATIPETIAVRPNDGQPNQDIKLRDAMFMPRLLLDHGTNALIRGSMLSSSKQIRGSTLLSADLTQHLFPFEFNFAQDLMARNVQRSREHEVPPFNQYRQFCRLSPLQTWDDAKQTFHADTNVLLLQMLYKEPAKIDLWIGGLLEKPSGDSILGPTFTCLMKLQFSNIRNGDSYWYENGKEFTPVQLQAIKKYTFTKLMCNTIVDLKKVPSNPFMRQDEAAWMDCSTQADLDLTLWRG